MPATGKTALRTGLGVDICLRRVFAGDGSEKPLFHGMAAPLLSSFKDLAQAA
jgi:hypothetical protein